MANVAPMTPPFPRRSVSYADYKPNIVTVAAMEKCDADLRDQAPPPAPRKPSAQEAHKHDLNVWSDSDDSPSEEADEAVGVFLRVADMYSVFRTHNAYDDLSLLAGRIAPGLSMADRAQICKVLKQFDKQ